MFFFYCCVFLPSVRLILFCSTTGEGWGENTISMMRESARSFSTGHMVQLQVYSVERRIYPI